jgi:hypothetical protein
LLELVGGSETRLASLLLRHTYFISPLRIRKRIEETGSAAWFPDCVRESKEHHRDKRKGQTSAWQGRPVRVWDNTKARLAFSGFTGLVMAGNREGRIRGYHVAHIWEHVYDPECFTAGWNLCLMPGFIKLFTEQQDRIDLLHWVVQQGAFDLYFKDGALGLPTPPFVSDPGIDLKADFRGVTLNLLE